jgi:hypothetical protein
MGFAIDINYRIERLAMDGKDWTKNMIIRAEHIKPWLFSLIKGGCTSGSVKSSTTFDAGLYQ